MANKEHILPIMSLYFSLIQYVGNGCLSIVHDIVIITCLIFIHTTCIRLRWLWDTISLSTWTI